MSISGKKKFSSILLLSTKRGCLFSFLTIHNVLKATSFIAVPFLLLYRVTSCKIWLKDQSSLLVSLYSVLLAVGKQGNKYSEGKQHNLDNGTNKYREALT